MGEIWKYGQYDLDTDTLLKLLQDNIDSYTDYYSYTPEQKEDFSRVLRNISEGIKSGKITGTGYGQFDDPERIIEKESITPKVFGYIHTVANALGRKYPKHKGNQGELSKELEDFNFENHGFSKYFLEQTNPELLNYELTNENHSDNFANWKTTFDSSEEAVKEFSNMLNLYKNRHDYSKLNFSKMGTTSEQYLKDIDDLQKVTADGILDKRDFRLLNKLGLQYLGPLLYNAPKEVKPGGGIQGNAGGTEVKPEGVEVKPGGDTKKNPKDVKPEEVTFIEPEKALSNNENAWNYYIAAKNLFKEESDQYRFAGLMADIASIIDPEPFTAAGFGYASDTLNLLADEKDGINDNYWDDALNYGLSTLGAIPIIGDMGMVGKIGKNMAKYAKVIGALATAPALVLAYEHYPEIQQSIKKFVDDFKSCTVEDYRNIWTGIQIALGVGNVGRTWHAKAKAKQINNTVEEALVVKVRDENGTVKELQFKGNDRTKLESLIDDPEGFKNYLKNNFKGLEEVELVNIGTKGGGLRSVRDMVKEKSLTKPKTKYVETRVARVYDKNKDIPSKWSRSRYFIDQGETIELPIKKTQEDLYGPKADTPKADAPTDTPKTDTSTGTPTEAPKTDIKDSKSVIDIPAGKFDDRGAVAATDTKPDITPDIKSKATEAADTKSAVSSFTKADIIAKLQKLTRKQGLNKALRQANSVKIDPSIASKVAKGDQIPSNGFNNLLSYLRKSGMSYDDAFKMLTGAGYYKKGGIIKAQQGTKFYGEDFDYDESEYGNLWGDAKIEGSLGGNSFRTNSTLSQKNSATLEELQDLNAYSRSHLPYSNSAQHQYDRLNDIHDALLNLINTDGATLEQAIGKYNKAITGIYDYKRQHGYKLGDEGEHVSRFNNLHKYIYNTPNNDGGIYGFDTRYSNINGTTTIQRGVDITDSDILLDFNNYNFTDSSGNTISGQFANSKVLEGLKNKKLYKSKTGHLYLMDAIKLEGTEVKPEGTVKPESGTETGYRHDVQYDTLPLPKIEKPIKPTERFFTFDKALGALNYYNALQHNKKQLQLSNSQQPLLYDPNEHYRSITGDLKAIMNGQKRAAAIMHTAATPKTSDSSLYLASLLEAQNLGQQYINEGLQTDDAAVKKSQEDSWQQEKENKNSRYNIAMKNRENMYQLDREKLLAKMTTKRADYDSTTNFINEWRGWLSTKNQKDQQLQQALYKNKLQNYIKQNPKEYIKGWGKIHDNVWNKYTSGAVLTPAENNIIQQINDVLENAYYSELYDNGYNPQHIVLPKWQDTYINFSGIKSEKHGGSLTKTQTDYIIKFLKESNSNYNKAIDRSIKGLYNSIKSQKKK